MIKHNKITSVYDSITFIHRYDFDKYMEVLKSIKGYPFKKIEETSKTTTATPKTDPNLELLVQHLSRAEIFRNKHIVMKLAASVSLITLRFNKKRHFMRQ